MTTQIIYFHGQPGSNAELDLLGLTAKAKDKIHVAERRIGASASFDEYISALCSDIAAKFPDRKLHLIGFSIGAFTALQVASKLGDKVVRIDLISAAAPLELDDFLPDMAGKAVFKFAQNKPKLFRMMTAAQAMLCRLSAKIMFNALFASAKGADITLAKDEGFQNTIQQAMRHTFKDGRETYCVEIEAYTQPWADKLKAINADTYIWHGNEDNWSPSAMAHALAQHLPNAKSPTMLDGKSHYSTLIEVAEAVVFEQQN